MLSNGERIMSSLTSAYDALYDSGQDAVIALLANTKNSLEQIERFGEKYGEIAKTISNIYYQTEDVAMELREMKSNLDFSPYRLEEIDNRLDVINRLCRKYGENEGKLLKLCEELEAEQYEIMHSQQIQKELKQEKRGFRIPALYRLF